jgi:guanylate kinase
MGRLIVLAGPSCVGKGPLADALRRFYPELTVGWQDVVIINSRLPRPGEVDGRDYHFRSREEVEALGCRKGYVVRQVRNDLQALDVGELERLLGAGDVFFEGNPWVAGDVLACGEELGVPLVTAFLSPLSREEIVYLSAPERHVVLPDFVKQVMQRKLLRRTARQKGLLSLGDLQDIDKRAGCAYEELCEAWQFGNVIVSHDGEDSENWGAFYYPLGDARKALEAFAGLLRGEPAAGVETWPEDLLPAAPDGG